MVNNTDIPPDMRDLAEDENTLGIFKAWPMTMRAQYIYKKVKFEGWPVEKSCVLFEMSSTWYRNQVLRFAGEWNKEHQDIIEEDRKHDRFFIRASDIMKIDFSDDKNKNRLENIISSIPPFQNEKEEDLFEYENVPNNFLTAAIDIFDCDNIPEDFPEKATELLYTA